jgi:hypothetical protein
MSQTRLGSLVESIVNVLIGFGVGVASQYYIFPLFDIHIPFWTNVEIAVWFTVISIARSTNTCAEPFTVKNQRLNKVLDFWTVLAYNVFIE